MVDDDVRSAPTLTEMMRRRAALSPDQQYFRLYDETVTYERLWAQSGKYAAGLARAGVAPGDKICLIYPTCAEFFYTFFGALRLGAVPVPLYPTLGVETTAAIFRDSEAVAVATIGWFRAGVDESCALAPNVRMVLEPPDLEIDAAPPPLAAATADDLAFLQYTSGSTGHPRGVMLTHQNVVSTIHFMAEAAGITVDDRRVRVALRPQAHHLAVLRPGRGHPGGRHLAAGCAAPARSERAVSLRGPAVPRRLGEDSRATGRGRRRACRGCRG